MERAQLARTAAINELKALSTPPIALREDLRSLSVIKLSDRCSRFRPDAGGDAELFGPHR